MHVSKRTTKHCDSHSRCQPRITIYLTNPQEAYTTGNIIQGNVTIQSPSDLDFQDIHVELTGTSRTLIERWSATPACVPYTEAAHEFLRLSQPDLQLKYPMDHTLRAGQNYAFSFTFVIPIRLPEGACRHPVSDERVRSAHHSLPPSLGDCDESGTRSHADDLSHRKASIGYGIVVTIAQQDQWPNERILARRSRSLRIVPATGGLLNPDVRCVSVHRPSGIHCTRKEETIKGGTLLRRQHLGTLVAEGAMSKEIQMHISPRRAGDTVTGTATARLHYKPAAGAHHTPPQLERLTTRLRIRTDISSKPCSDFPQHSDVLFDATKSRRNDTFPLAERALSGVKWYTCAPAFDTASPPFAIDLAIPVTLPSNRSFVPTFHSCYVSRTYALDICMSYTTAGVRGSIDLCLPLELITQYLDEQPKPSDYESSILPEYEYLRALAGSSR